MGACSMALLHCTKVVSVSHSDSLKVRENVSKNGSCLIVRRHWILRARKIAKEEDIVMNQQLFKAEDSPTTAIYATAMDSMPPEGLAVLMSCVVGLLTGVGVVAFNYTVHEIHDIVWQGVPRVTWLRSQPLEKTWQHIMVVPVGGGLAVGMINSIQALLDEPTKGSLTIWRKLQTVFRPFLKALAAAVTLGTGSSLGPEGPSVEIGASVANGVGTAFRNSRERTRALVAAGSAAGISSGFNAAVAGCFFAVESVLRSSPADSAPSLTTAMVLLSSVLASVVSQAGLGTDPAFKIPAYDFRSPTELPLYLLLGTLCGGVSIALTKGCAYATSMFDNLQKSSGIPAGLLPPIGGLCVAVIALAYPEVLYWGFENVDAILESRPWAKGPPADLLIQIVGAKLVATSLCRGSRLVGGVYAPSLFIGAALGSAYGKIAGDTISHANPMYHLDTLQVAAPQAYALVGMAATLAGVCQVPLTAVLLLFELTRDYRIILPLMAAVGLSSWIASSFPRKDTKSDAAKPDSKAPAVDSDDSAQRTLLPREDICSLDESLCVANVVENELVRELLVSAAMKGRYLTVSPNAAVGEAVSLMLRDKEWCVLVIGKDEHLEGILTLGDIQDEAEKASSTAAVKVSEMKVSSICRRKITTAKPDMHLKRAQRLMAERALRQLPVVAKDGRVVGLIDQESIKLACRAEATRRLLGSLANAP